MSTGSTPSRKATTHFQRLRKRHKLRISEVAKMADVSWPTAQSWDLAKTVPSSSDALRLIGALKSQKGITIGLADLVDPS